MPVLNYHVANGRMRGQSTAGSRTDYLTDALGSVTGTVTSTSALENAYRHKPYGQPLSKTGSGVDPRFLWTGDTGSRTTGIANAEQYNRARHYGNRSATWTSVDPLWPSESPYGYVDGNPTTWADPEGFAPLNSSPKCKDDVKKLCKDLRGTLRNREAREKIKRCIGNVTSKDPTVSLDRILDRMSAECNPYGWGYPLCVVCGTQDIPVDARPFCKGICNGQDGEHTGSVALKSATLPIVSKNYFPTDCESGSPPQRIHPSDFGLNTSAYLCASRISASMKICGGVIILCKTDKDGMADRFYHELAHVIGISGVGKHNEKAGKGDLVYKIGECLAKERLPKKS